MNMAVALVSSNYTVVDPSINCTLILQTLEALEADPAVRGVIWASGLKRDVFTAGNDLKVTACLKCKPLHASA